MLSLSARASRGPHEGSPFVLAFGDSLTAGYGLAPSEAFPARLETLLRQEWPTARVQNAGVSGNTSGDALARLPRLLSSLEVRPDLAIVEFGGNDLLRGISLDRTRANLDAILLELGRSDIPVLLAVLEAPRYLGAFAERCDAVYADLAARHGVAAVPFFPSGILGDPDFTLRDGLHPNARAIGRVAEAMLPAVEAAIRERSLVAA
jgi:acyl-CoA thioesterase-1